MTAVDVERYPSENSAYWKIEAEKVGNDLSTNGLHFVTICGLVTFSCAISFLCVSNFSASSVDITCYFGGVFYVGQLISSVTCWWKTSKLNEYNFRLLSWLVPLYSFTTIMTSRDVQLCFDGTQYSSDDKFEDVGCSSLSTGLLIAMTVSGLMPVAFTITNDLKEGNDLTVFIFIFMATAILFILCYCGIVMFTLYPVLMLFDSLSCGKYKLVEKYVVAPGVRSSVKAMRKVFCVFKERSVTDKYLYDTLGQEVPEGA